MKVMELLRFVAFIIAGLSIYCYMGNLVAAAKPKRVIIDMTPKEARVAWKIINNLEDSWYDDNFNLAAPNQQQINMLVSIVQSYPDLREDVKNLIVDRKNNQYEEFMTQKNKIGQILKPLLTVDVEAKMDKEGWLEWIKNKIRNAMTNAYGYFFTAQQNK